MSHPQPVIMRIRGALALLALSVAGCNNKESSEAADAATGATGGANNAAQLVVRSLDGSFSVQLPLRWSGVYRVDTLSSAEQGMARPGALNIVYLPSDSTVIPQTLVVVAVYDSASWTRVKAEGGPPPGDSAFAKDGRVYILSLPQSNPFAPGSVDAFKFDSLALTDADKARMISVP